ncbi:hypothetical protein GLYMA_19G012200v4 [Glycine max]|uniref:Uncharacterized protein n=2 Tax=Glycine subgen. Soja TaxID=1462606 RepID=A0A0R0EQD9_SOYBN|nr:hypothetical protein GYH30_051688 [Glycine max]KRG93378.1 hypothetical protein GLYMA_19G012200v4 [Glycine max]RZB45954.1 hypothetical protein D0Y65_050126 [Glycine soja]
MYIMELDSKSKSQSQNPKSRRSRDVDVHLLIQVPCLIQMLRSQKFQCKKRSKSDLQN